MMRTFYSVLAAVGLSLLALSCQATLLINEVDADTEGNDNAEFIELYNGGRGATSLTGYVLVLYNGSNDRAYLVLDLSARRTNAEGYFVVCGSVATIAGCGLEIGNNILQNGADAVALYHGSVADFPKGTAVTASNLVDALVYGTRDADDRGLLSVLMLADPVQVDEGSAGDKDRHSSQRCATSARSGAAFQVDEATPGARNSCHDQPEQSRSGQCGDPTGVTRISAIQGRIRHVSDDTSPLNNRRVLVEAVVTLDARVGYGGFWIQEEDADADNDARSSEGVFVKSKGADIRVGDTVRLEGTVGETSGVTRLGNIRDLTVCRRDTALPRAQPLVLPVRDLADWEALEGMRVHSHTRLLVADLYGAGYGLGNYGQLVVSSSLHFQPTDVVPPGSEAADALLKRYALDRLLVDDGMSGRYPTFIPFPDATTGYRADNPVRIGDSFTTLSGVIHHFKNDFMLIPERYRMAASHARTPTPTVSADANLRIASMNVLNYFNGDGQGGGFPASRGASTYAAFQLQSSKVVAAMAAMDADIIGLMEIENDGYDKHSAIQQLLDAMNALQAPGDEYAFVDPGTPRIGTDAITVGLLYRPGRLRLRGTTQVLSSANSPRDRQGVLFNDRKHRPSLIQSFEFHDFVFTLSINHFKSKGSACHEQHEGADGQGNCNLLRTRAATGLLQYLQTQPTGVTSTAVLVMGDLNAYSQEDPLQVLLAGGYHDLKRSDVATEAKPYTYSYNGLLGSLDHALATATFADHVVSAGAWHINSVEDALMGYETDANGQSYASVDHYGQADSYRSSDHDPVVIGLRVGSSGQ
ncbi:ExeM/NucH family extracellular endonuclease [Oceanobacter sp. 4_MG-2023]|uniref:ExeM/NucH family extracellular endonuclease n=1 Tax=Oceanobacter sp. 4_MG-2023 TaxID=3062623 RepID=UPI0027373346|nr:ExeM/NucH family extracellular endonuclease [Oceanobacter sp. 4_MG-2023]MDP2548579.1 ExeM/NucH family extracellular endonuclease [Oceanobacter sp. 4_MG-2023]